MDQQILISGLTYVKLGLPIIPFCSWDHEGISPNSKHNEICKCKGKVPLIKWREHDETSTQDIVRWKNQFKAYNIGMALGHTGYIGIDIDGDEGEQIYKDLKANRDEPETWEYKTGAGRRLIYAIPEGLATKKSINTGKGTHTECSILAEGQITVLPPSIHHTGRRYEWIPGHSPNDCDCAMAPTWLIDLVRADKNERVKRHDALLDQAQIMVEQQSKNPVADLIAAFQPEVFSSEIPEDIASGKNKPVKSKDVMKEKSWQQMLNGEVISEGGRNNAITKFIGSLLSEEFIRRAGKDAALTFIYQFNKKCLDPPLTEEEIKPQLDSFWEQETLKTAAYKQKLKNAKLPWIPLDILASLEDRLSELNLTYVFDSVLKTSYYFKDDVGPWTEDVNNSNLRNIFYDLMQSEQWDKPDWARPQKADEIIKMMQDKSTKKQDIISSLFIESGDREDLQAYLPVDGKLLNWRTGSMMPWQQNFLTLANFEIGYDKDAKCPHWEEYMKQWLPNKAYRQFLQEFLGCALLPKPDGDGKFVILVGDGSNGKSMCMNAIESIFGNTGTSQELGRLQARFGAAKLYGKRLNICSEIEDGSGYLSAPGVIKRLVTGETMDIEFKGKDCFDYRPVASHIFSCNALPRVRDKSAGWYRRQVVIPFEQTFKARADVAYVMNKHIKEERAGIFNWLIEGLKRKLDRGYYVIPEELQQYQETVREEQDPLLQFLNIFVDFEFACKTKTTATDLFKKKYTASTKKHGICLAFLHKLYCLWYKCYISDTSKSIISLKGFRNYLETTKKVTVQGQCICVTKNKQSTCILGIDFKYNNAMIDTFYEMLESNDDSLTLSTSILESLKTLQKYCKQKTVDGTIQLI